MSRTFRTVRDVRLEKLRHEARADHRDEVRQARKALRRTSHGFAKFGGVLRRLARMKADRRLRELVGSVKQFTESQARSR